jgi:hypothetical protein
MRAYALAARDAKVPCIASDPRCPCNDGDTCNYVATNSTPAFEVPHPDAAQLISIADLMSELSGADPTMLANVGHYLRGLSDRVKVLPVARTGPLRVAAETVSAPVEEVPPLPEPIIKRGDVGPLVRDTADQDYYTAEQMRAYRATTPLQAEPSIEQQLQNAREDFATMRALTESGATEIARLAAELAQANAMCESLAVSVQDLANAKAAVDEAHAIELADEKAVVDVLRSELQDRLQKQRAAEAELEEVRQDAQRYRWLRDVGDATWRPFGLRHGCSATQADQAIDNAIAKINAEAPKP